MKPEPVLVLGGTRFIGRALVRRLLAEDVPVHVLTRTREHARGLDGAVIHAGDRRDPIALRAAAAAGPFRCVFDFLGMDGADATIAVDAFRNRTERLVHISTGAIYWVQAATRTPWIESDDGLPLRDRATCDHGEFDYGIAKRDAESVYRAAAALDGFPSILVRAPVVSGPEDWRRRDLYWVRRILEDRPCVMPDGGLNVFNHVFVDDLVDMLSLLAGMSPIDPGEPFNACDRVFTTLRDYVSWFGDVLGKKPRLVDVPRATLAAAGLHDRSFYFADTKSHVLDNRKSEDRFGRLFRTPDAWIPPTAAWCRAQAALPEEDLRLAAELRLLT